MWLDIIIHNMERRQLSFFRFVVWLYFSHPPFVLHFLIFSHFRWRIYGDQKPMNRPEGTAFQLPAQLQSTAGFTAGHSPFSSRNFSPQVLQLLRKSQISPPFFETKLTLLILFETMEPETDPELKSCRPSWPYCLIPLFFGHSVEIATLPTVLHETENFGDRW